jgi:beta-barrel assembly-enhancing protease
MELRRFGMRLVIGLIIAAIGVFVYYKNVEENPVTGAKQHVSLSPDEEIRLGLRAAPRMASEMGGELEAADPRRQVVEKLGARLLNLSSGKKGPWNFQFHVLSDDKTINAFALPGGQIFGGCGRHGDK